jgi:hypothetical protein
MLEASAAEPPTPGFDPGLPERSPVRPYGGYYYAAFVLDPDGHNIEAVFHGDRLRR